MWLRRAQIRRADTISNNVVNDTKHILGHNNGITLESSMTHWLTASWNSITQLEVGFSSMLVQMRMGGKEPLVYTPTTSRATSTASPPKR